MASLSELAMRLQNAQAEFFELEEPARAAAALAPALGTTEPMVGTVRRFVAKGEALREAICVALPTAMTELPGGGLQCGAPSQADSAAACRSNSEGGRATEWGGFV